MTKDSFSPDETLIPWRKRSDGCSIAARRCSKPACREFLRWAMCAQIASSALHRRWARERSRCLWSIGRWQSCKNFFAAASDGGFSLEGPIQITSFRHLS